MMVNFRNVQKCVTITDAKFAIAICFGITDELLKRNVNRQCNVIDNIDKRADNSEDSSGERREEHLGILE